MLTPLLVGSDRHYEGLYVHNFRHIGVLSNAKMVGETVRAISPDTLVGYQSLLL